MTATTATTLARTARPRGLTWSSFAATTVMGIKSFYRQPQALAFTLGQPFILLLILNSFNFQFTLPSGEQRPYLDRLLPGLIAFNGMTVGLNSTAFALSRDKSRGTLRRLRATPIPTAAFVGGLIVSRVVVAFAVTVITYLAGVYVFGAELGGNALVLIALGVFGAAIFIAIGILMVAAARSEDDLPPMFILVLMPSMLFSGAFLDRGGLPGWLHTATDYLPLTFLAKAVQQVSLLDAGFGDIRGELLGLVVWGVAAAGLAAWKFRLA